MAYIEPMHWLTWIGLFVLLATGPPLLYLAARYLTNLNFNIFSELSSQIALFSLLFFGTMLFWHWEAMLISFLAKRFIPLPFKDIPDLFSNTQFRIILTPGSFPEDAFKTSLDPVWQTAWTDRVQPHLEEHVGFSKQDFAKKVARDGVSAWYEMYSLVM